MLNSHDNPFLLSSEQRRSWTTGFTAQMASDARFCVIFCPSVGSILFPHWWQYMCEKLIHYIDVIMSAIASQITSLTIVYLTVYSGTRSKKTSKLPVTDLCEGNSPVTGEFSAQRVSNAEMFPFDDVIMWCKFWEGQKSCLFIASWFVWKNQFVK